MHVRLSYIPTHVCQVITWVQVFAQVTITCAQVVFTFAPLEITCAHVAHLGITYAQVFTQVKITCAQVLFTFY